MPGAPDSAGRADLEAAVAALDRAAGSRASLHARACVRCGLCGQSCHVYLAEPVPANLPAAKVEKIASLLRGRRTFLGRHAPWLTRARDVTPEALEDLTDAVFGRCTGCGRCALHCSVGLDVAGVVYAARHVLAAAGLTPSGLRQTIDNQIRDGNQMSITPEELVETAGWLSEELARETGDPAARVRVDEAGSRVLYLVNPREVKFFPLSLQAAAGVFHAARESWTLSSRAFDVTNYGFYGADDDAATELTRRAVEEARHLGASEIVLSECGHGFRSFRWEGPEWLGGAYPVRVRSVLELLDEYLTGNRLRVDPRRNALPVTLHDPCNLVRWGGIVEPQRRILARVTEHLVEMTPNREQNFCCGGGGGMLSMEEYGARRVASGAVKVAQIRETGARVVACPCHNCADQLIELTRIHALDVEIRSVVEIVYDAIDWGSRHPRRGAPGEMRRKLLLPLVPLLLAAALSAAAGDGYFVGPWGLTYARYDPALFGPEKPLRTVLEERGIGLGLAGKLEGARLLVIKSARRCELWVGDTMVKAYRIQLSQRSTGTKSRRHDQRTPEGNYSICAHRPSKYHRGLSIDYPSLTDADRGVAERRIAEVLRAKIAEALGRGECPPQNTGLGGFIMFHGQQRSLTHSLRRAGRGGRRAPRSDLVQGDADPGSMREYHDWTAGCIAMFNPDIRELYNVLPDGTPVTIVAGGPVTRPASR